ncbi:hypothetical protein C0J52_12815 [Blattella germanica]|nr:hypothetical protein C0J52_12815 [Blattella germanica]
MAHAMENSNPQIGYDPILHHLLNKSYYNVQDHHNDEERKRRERFVLNLIFNAMKNVAQELSLDNCPIDFTNLKSILKNQTKQPIPLKYLVKVLQKKTDPYASKQEVSANMYFLKFEHLFRRDELCNAALGQIWKRKEKIVWNSKCSDLTGLKNNCNSFTPQRLRHPTNQSPPAVTFPESILKSVSNAISQVANAEDNLHRQSFIRLRSNSHTSLSTDADGSARKNKLFSFPMER